MSRVGKEPIALPKEVKAKISGSTALIEGPKGKLSLDIPEGISVDLTDSTIIVKRGSDEKKIKSIHGTIRALLYNMVIGVSVGFKRELDIVGVGYKALLKGKTLVLNVGFSKPVEMAIPQELKVSLTIPTHIIIEGIDKQRVGEFAAVVRRIYPPEPYKGKGIRYTAEEVRKKLGKALAK